MASDPCARSTATITLGSTRVLRRIAAVSLACLLTSSEVLAQYEIVHIGTLGGDYSGVAGINDNGLVVGTSRTAGGVSEHAFLWTRTGGMVDLDPNIHSLSLGGEVNNAGHVAGVLVRDEYEFSTFFWSASGGIVDLGTFGGSRSQPSDMNDASQIVGWSFLTNDAAMHAFSWTPGGGMVDLGTLGGNYSMALAVNEKGHVVGSSTIPGDLESHAFLWTPGGGMVDLGVLGGGQSGASDVNDNGQVVGTLYFDMGRQRHAFSWTSEGGMLDVGTFGGPNSDALAVNNRGQVLGSSDVGGGMSHPFVWTVSGGMVDIEALVGWTTRPTAINDKGQVVGFSHPTGVGAPHAFSWTESAGMVDLGQGRADAVNTDGWIPGEQSSTGGPAGSAVWIPLGFNFESALSRIEQRLREYSLRRGGLHGLTAKLKAALRQWQQARPTAAVNTLRAFVNQVKAQRGKTLTNAQADALVGDASAIAEKLAADEPTRRMPR